MRIRMILILTLLISLAGGLLGQETTTTATTTTATTTTATATIPNETKGETPNSYELRSAFSQLLRDHPPEVAMILKLDPSMLANEAFMSGYPQIVEFVNKNPQIRANPRFYLAEFRNPGQENGVLDHIAEAVAIIGGFGLATFAFIWLVRTIIEQKRWNKLSKTQSEVHNKILDRFSSSDELLNYIRTPAGTKFLESAPIPLHADRSAQQSAPVTRIMWSIQIGIVIAIGALGMLLVSFRFEGESAEGLFALGAIGFCVGAGFIASALVSMKLFRRLGIWPGGDEVPPPSLDEQGLMR